MLEVAPFGDLADLLSEESIAFPSEVVLAWLLDIIDAIEFLRSRQVRHRDIQAESFLVFPHLKLQLCNLGLARSQKVKLHSSTTVGGGTLAFTAPEGMVYGTAFAADIYAFAMTAVQVITRGLLSLEGFPSRLPRQWSSLNSEEGILLKTIKESV